MSESRERAEHLFEAALALSSAARQSFLAQSCGDDKALRIEVEELLQAHAEGEFLEQPAAPLPGRFEPDALVDTAPGTLIGRYKLLEKLGEGGCGSVYLAEQQEPIRRRVALKLIKLGMDTREVIARFEAERQALALMDHPNIARVFDCGATEAGRPYFVMEWVKGVPITKFCEAQRLTAEQRQQLFILVCRAVQHAHDTGVVHRDLKPSNVLVTVYDGAPAPKVIDFGVAKATEGRLEGKTVATAHAEFIGTPAYMSPEQAAMGAAIVDARSDIYSLGVLLYELLTGHTPFSAKDLTDGGFDEMRRRIREDDPALPSARLASMDEETRTAIASARAVNPPSLIGRLRGDLDLIVMRCLEKDPARRYASAAELADEIERHLHHEPIQSAAPGLGAVLQRFERRHRAALQITLVAAAALALGGLTMWSWPRPHIAATQAVADVSPQSIAVLPFENLSPDPDNAFFADGVHEDLIMNLAKIHDLKVTSRTSVMAYRKGGNLRAIAAELGVANILEGSVRRFGKKIRVTVQLVNARTDEPIWADSYDRDLTDVFALQTELAKNIADTLHSTLTDVERQLIDRPATSSADAYDLYLRGRAQYQALGQGGTVQQYQDIIVIFEKAVEKDPKFALAYVQIALVDSTLYWFSNLDPTPERIAAARVAAETAARLAPEIPETKLALGVVAYTGSRDWETALAQFRAAELDLPHDDQLFTWIGNTMRRLGRWQEGLESYQRAAELNPQAQLPGTYSVQSLYWLRRYAEAAALAARYATRFPADRGFAFFRVVATYEKTGDREAFVKGMDALPPDPKDPNGLIEHYLTATYRGDWPAAAQALADPRLKQLPDQHLVIVDPVAFHRALAANAEGHMDDAARLADEAIAMYRRHSWAPRQKPWALLRIAQAEALAGRADEAIRDGEAAWTEANGRDAIDTVQMQPLLGQIYLLAGRRDEALAILQRAMDGPCDWGPNQIQLDPIWSRLKTDPRFEAILQSAKQL
jgi:serine/threonine protein kinase